MTKKNELTKKSISESFISLIRTHPIEKITVRMIMEEVGLSRKTFYYHFQDIDDLIEWIFHEEIRKYFDWEQGKNVRERELYHGLFNLLEDFEQERKFLGKAFGLEGPNSLKENIRSTLELVLHDLVSQKHPRAMRNPAKVDFVIAIYCSATIGVIEDWIAGHLTYPLSEAMEIMREMISSSIIVIENGKDV